MRSTLIAAVFVCLFSVLSTAAQRVHEKASEVIFRGNEAIVRLAVTGDTPQRNVAARVSLIDPNGLERSSGNIPAATIGTSRQMLEFRLPITALSDQQNEDLAWYRLTYRVGDTVGIASVSQLARELFELRILAASNVMTGMGYRIRVRALNPFTEAPSAGVEVAAELELDAREGTGPAHVYRGSGITDRDGFAAINFDIPAEVVLAGDGTITVSGVRNGLRREASDELEAVENDLDFLMMTDKPIYQPEQTLNIRGILFKGSASKTVLANEEIEFRIEDEDDTLLFRERVHTSGFGVAAISWSIPSNAKLGEYTIIVRDSRGDNLGVNRIKVSRYDLPNFSVTTKSSKPYYLPADRFAEVEVRADYLFGKPVTKGKVRVVEETSREWNWKEQKYDIDEGQVREGVLDRSGKFVARLDLSDAHDEIEDEDTYRQFHDVSFAAYLTDATTNKTEQRRFDIRVTREPIHVYMVDEIDDQHPDLPFTAYISTFYADGTPAECDVEIKASEDDEEKYKTIARIPTNKFGAGKFVGERPKIGEPDDDLDLRLIARDRSGRRGTRDVEDASFDPDEHALQVTTDRAIYRPGETMMVDVVSTVKSGLVYIDVVNNWSVIDSLSLRLEDGRGSLSIPYREVYKGQMTVAAFIEDPEDDDDLIVGTRGVIFPAMQGIAVETTFDKAIYKPNEEGTVKFGVIDAVGQAIESALGIVMLDKAVEERARTDAEFGSMFQGLGGWLGYGGSFGSTNVKDLNDLDMTKPISDELQLVGEIILHNAYYNPNLFHSKRYHDQGYSMYGTVISAQFVVFHNALTDAYREHNFLHPTDDASLRQIFGLYGLDLAELRDPWGVPYRTAFGIDRAERKVLIWSNGPDKEPDTKDDFIVLNRSFGYFVPISHKLNDAIREHHARTGGFIRDEKTLLSSARLPELVDVFGRAYRISFTPETRYLNIEIRSLGKDGKYDQYTWRGDDFVVWSNRQDVFAPLESRIREAQRNVKKVPNSEAEIRSQLRSAGITDEMLRDAAGMPLYINAERKSRFWNRTHVETVQVYGETTKTDKTVITPVTQEIMQFTFRSPGRDGKPGTYDDATMMQLVHVISERSKDDKEPVEINKIAYNRNSGAIAGKVTDASGAAIPGATVTATSGSGLTRSTTTRDDGSYLLSGLPAGSYTLQIDATGFQRWVMNAVPVQANATVRVDASLEVGSISAVVEVTASGEATVNATSASIVANQVSALPLMGRQAQGLLLLQPGTAAGKDTSTPRLREYFPETLLWQPEVITGADGKAEVKFRMADNITTWKMYTIASTKNGKVGFAEKEVTAFQSFFVDLDPPKFLTDGDEIFLPTQVRNYTTNRQRVNVTMSSADWYSFIGGGDRQVDVASGQSENAVFGFKAVKPIKDGKQRVTAIAQDESDAIEKPVTVRPDGREIVATESRFFNGNTSFDVNFPSNSLPGTHSAELKIYPNLMAHVAESVEGLLMRPYGCGEQTVSSTYPNLMIIKFAGADGMRMPPDTLRQARKNLQDGYDRLIGYQVASGGVAYWSGRDEADLALTAYAMRFLTDAAPHIAVDPAIISKAENWLLSQQRPDGSWNRKYSWETTENTARALSLTTYIARTLAMLKSDESTARNAALTKALAYLRLKNSQIDDPYSLALLGLALHDSRNAELATTIANKLVTLGRDERSATYWNLESNTVFNGWGSAGRIETTALVTQLLMKVGAEEHKAAAAKGMVFLLRNKDRYGVWYSTQTTINVLDTFIASLASNEASGSQTVDVIVNGETIRTLEIGPENIEQILIPVTERLTAAGNTIELRATGGESVMAQAVSRHYIGWPDADSSGRNVNASRAVELDYKCDRYEAAIMQEVSCTVRAERVGFRGYGMLLAEIGTPPGADVSRESLEKALESADGISKYEILPDRVIVYMWARPGGTTMNFKFRPRYGINAQTPASVVYDYYNPEAQAVAAPMKFAVR